MVEEHDLGQLVRILCEAIGQPGQRRFRLQLLAGDGRSADIWMEKTQLSALGEAIENVLKDEGYRHRALAPDDQPEAPPFPLRAAVEIDARGGEMGLGLNRESELVVIRAAGRAESEETVVVEASFDFWRAAELRELIDVVVASGRPPCPLCHAPMDPEGHRCPRRNGHHPQDD